MNRTTWIWVVAALSVAILASAAPAEDGLTTALAMIPADLQDTLISYTDWHAIKTEMGVPWLTSKASEDVRIGFAVEMSKRHAVASGYGLQWLRVHAASWGFDSTDLLWEANVLGGGLPFVYLLRLRDDFDMAGLTARFIERGFTQTESFGATIYSHAMDVRSEWVRTTELSIHNTAVFAEEHLLVLSSSPSALDLYVRAKAGVLPTLSTASELKPLFDSLDSSLAAHVLLGASTCLRFNPNPLLEAASGGLDEEEIAALRAWIASGDPLHAYVGLAVGYRYEGSAPSGLFSFLYVSEDDAQADLAPRRLLATTGSSTVSEKPVSETYFVLEDAWVDETLLCLVGYPVNSQPSRLFRSILYADAPFAACR